MAAQARLAEIKFIRQGVSIYGLVSAMDADGVSIQPQTIPTNAQALTPGAPAELAIVGRGAIYMASARVRSFKEGVLALLFTEPVRRMQRRGAVRRPCRLAVAYRAIRPDGCAGAWHNAVTLDVSVGGMAILLDAAGELPQRVSLSFALPYEDSPIKVSARVVHSRHYGEGLMAVGLSFTTISQLDRLRLNDFTNMQVDSVRTRTTRYA